MDRHHKYSVALIGLVAVTSLFLWTVSWRLEPMEGDLTRIGDFRERDYAPRSPQYRYGTQKLVSDIYDRPVDILVVGDSFSWSPVGGSWLDHFIAKTGLRVAVTGHEWQYPNKFLQLPAYQKFRPQVVIYESAERLLKERLNKPTAVCSVGPAKPAVRLERRPLKSKLAVHVRAYRKTWGQVDITQAWDYLWVNLMRQLSGNRTAAQTFRLKRPLFSSRLSRQLLILRSDLVKKAWSVAMLERISCNIKNLQAMTEEDGQTLFVALLIPDKTSAYASELVAPRPMHVSVLPRLDLHGVHSVPAAAALERAVQAGELDVYLPNDSHLGEVGARITAEAVISKLVELGVLSK
jgi:hypothetical protein